MDGLGLAAPPEVPDTWYNIDAAGYDVKIKALIDKLVARYKIDKRRIYVMGASAGATT